MLTPEVLTGKNILLRADLDVPLEGERVANDYRLVCLLPTLRLCLAAAQRTLIIGHLGRPEGAEPRFSLAPVQKWLETALHQAIPLLSSGFSPGEWVRGASPISLLENIRFWKGELDNDLEFARQIAVGADFYVYDAFAAYNPAASLQKIPEIVLTITGLQFDREVTHLDQVLKKAASPRLLLLSGVKDDKKKFIDSFLGKFDEILVGGRLALLVPAAQTPQTAVIPASLTDDGFDISLKSTLLFLKKIRQAKTIVINGPLGRFEDVTHAVATKTVLQAAKDSRAYTVIGGGDTLAAIKALGFRYTDFTFVSTGGGAMLEFLATGTHPLLEVLKKVQSK